MRGALRCVPLIEDVPEKTKDTYRLPTTAIILALPQAEYSNSSDEGLEPCGTMID